MFALSYCVVTSVDQVTRTATKNLSRAMRTGWNQGDENATLLLCHFSYGLAN